MCVTLLEVIEASGYDLSTVKDANWLISKVTEFENLVIKAEDLLEEL